jgi:hypothetical protein
VCSAAASRHASVCVRLLLTLQIISNEFFIETLVLLPRLAEKKQKEMFSSSRNF